MSIRTYFENISNAIKEKNPIITTVTPAEMPNAILSIPSGGGEIDLTKISFVGLYCTARRGGGYGYCQISELQLFNDNNAFSFPSDRVAFEGGGYATGQGEFAYNIFDGNVNTKGILNMYPQNVHPFGWFMYMPNNTVDATVFNKWKWYTANDSADRDPVSFGLVLGSGKMDENLICKCFDFQTNYNVPMDRKSIAYSGVIE